MSTRNLRDSADIDHTMQIEGKQSACDNATRQLLCIAIGERTLWIFWARQRRSDLIWAILRNRGQIERSASTLVERRRPNGWTAALRFRPIRRAAAGPLLANHDYPPRTTRVPAIIFSIASYINRFFMCTHDFDALNLFWTLLNKQTRRNRSPQKNAHLHSYNFSLFQLL